MVRANALENQYMGDESLSGVLMDLLSKGKHDEAKGLPNSPEQIKKVKNNDNLVAQNSRNEEAAHRKTQQPRHGGAGSGTAQAPKETPLRKLKAKTADIENNNDFEHHQDHVVDNF
jgi:hypothetical protein